VRLRRTPPLVSSFGLVGCKYDTCLKQVIRISPVRVSRSSCKYWRSSSAFYSVEVLLLSLDAGGGGSGKERCAGGEMPLSRYCCRCHLHSNEIDV
jgi:hypothetical protein